MYIMGVDITKTYLDLSAQATSPDTAAARDLGFEKGSRFMDHNGNEYIYLAGVASCAAGSWVTFNQADHSTALLAANAIGPVAVAVGACTASYAGWFQIYGACSNGKCLTQMADNGQVWATATAGSVDDASVAGDLVNRARASALTTVDSGFTSFELHYPYVDNNSSAS